MIYEEVQQDAPVRQGDIFRSLPRIDVSLQKFVVLARKNPKGAPATREMSWQNALEDKDVVELVSSGDDPDGARLLLRAILPVSPVSGIVITQDCDAERAEGISLCEIAPLESIFKGAKDMNSARASGNAIIRQDSSNLKWFYLPADEKMGVSCRCAVDFQSILRLPRVHIDTLRQFRVSRLNHVAYQHFREKLAQFFRRYPYDPWYPLTKEEFEEYHNKYPDAKPYPWQS